MKRHLVESDDTSITEIILHGLQRVQGSHIDLWLDIQDAARTDGEIIRVEFSSVHYKNRKVVEMEDCLDLKILPRAAIDSFFLVNFRKATNNVGALAAAFAAIASKAARLEIRNAGDEAHLDLRIGEFRTTGEAPLSDLRNFLLPV